MQQAEIIYSGELTTPPTDPDLVGKYRRVVSRRSRLELLVELAAPEFVSPTAAGAIAGVENDIPGIATQPRQPLVAVA
jgi:hypothetical protein